MSRTKYTEEEKIRVARDYLAGMGSTQSLAEAIGAGKTTVKNWIKNIGHKEKVDSAEAQETTDIQKHLR